MPEFDEIPMFSLPSEPFNPTARPALKAFFWLLIALIGLAMTSPSTTFSRDPQGPYEAIAISLLKNTHCLSSTPSAGGAPHRSAC